MVATGIVIAISLAGCAGSQQATRPSVTGEAGSAQTPAPVQEARPRGPIVLSGTVAETMNAGGYTYIALEKDGKKGWVAVPVTDIKVGQEVQVQQGMEMGQFSSKSLNRTFDNILFSPGLVTAGASDAQPGATQAAMPPGHPAAAAPAPAQAQMPPGHPATGAKPAKKKGMAAMMGGSESKGTFSGKVVETMDSGGYTYVALEKEGKTTWAAIPTMPVKVGQDLELESGATMTNFTSKSLNKTFDSVIFSGGPVAAAPAAEKPAADGKAAK